jgi:hypothetical protein
MGVNKIQRDFAHGKQNLSKNKGLRKRGENGREIYSQPLWLDQSKAKRRILRARISRLRLRANGTLAQRLAVIRAPFGGF